MQRRARPRPDWVLLAAAVACAVYWVKAFSVVRPGRGVSYAGESAWLASWFLIGGAALFVAGLATLTRHRLVGALAIASGVCWLAPAWEGWFAGRPLVRSFGGLAAAWSFPLLVHLAVNQLAPRWPRGRAVFVAATYVTCGLGATAVVLVRDPGDDPYCWSNCTAHSFLVDGRPVLARRLTDGVQFATLVAAVVLVAICLVGLWRSRWWIAPGGVLLGVSTAAYVVARRIRPLEWPGSSTDALLFELRSLSVILIAAGLTMTLLREQLQRARVADVVRALDPNAPAGTVAAALAEAVGDLELEIAYPLGGSGRFVDAAGRPIPRPVADGKRTSTPLTRDGTTVAVVSHSVSLTDLERALGSALLLTLDNERLQAELNARLRELTDSRARIVAAGDAHRRALERNLHDGAQQRLLALSYDLSAAKTQAAAVGDETLMTLLDEAIVEVSIAFDELRQVAHGIFPAVLSAMGLGVAVAERVDSCQLPVSLRSTLGDTRFDPVVETAAYAVATDGLEIAERLGATQASIDLMRRNGSLVVDIATQRRPSAIDMTRIADRVGAVGGNVVARSDGFRAELPCGS